MEGRAVTYYVEIDGQRYDRKLLELAPDFWTLRDVARVLGAIGDSGRYTPIEFGTVKKIAGNADGTDAAKGMLRAWLKAYDPRDFQKATSKAHSKKASKKASKASKKASKASKATSKKASKATSKATSKKASKATSKKASKATSKATSKKASSSPAPPPVAPAPPPAPPPVAPAQESLFTFA